MILAVLLACGRWSGPVDTGDVTRLDDTSVDTHRDTADTADATDSADSATDTGASPVREYAALITSLLFDLGEEEHSVGFDLDGTQDACGVADFTSATGAPSIDNGFARYAPLAPAGHIAGVQADIQVGLIEGQTLAAFELTELDDLRDDPSVTLTFYEPTGELLQDAAGTGVLAWQTLARGSSVGPPVQVALVDGVIETRDLHVQLPMIVGAERGHLAIAGGVRLILPPVDPADPDALVTGFLSGSTDSDEARSFIPPGQSVQVYDIARAGVCDRLSIAFALQATPVFLLTE